MCKKSFCLFFGIGKSRVERIVKLLQNNVPSSVDRRGKHRNRGNIKDEHILFQIDTHIQSFPARQSQFSRSKNDEVRYLSPDLNISKMYNLYLMKYENETWELMKNKNNSIKPTVSDHFYRNRFYTNFKLSLGYTRSDTCQTCDNLVNLISTENDENIF